MLDEIYMQILDMTKIASIVILIVLLARLCLKIAPKVISYVLWSVVLFRLLCPVSLEASISIVPDIAPISQNYTLSEQPISIAGASDAAYQAVGDALNGGLGIQRTQTTEQDSDGMTKNVATDWWDVWLLFGQYVWIAGIAIILLYSAVSYLKIRKKLIVVVPLRDNIFIADDIKSPFVIGLFHPKIYLPCNLNEKEQEYIILHEQHHIKRLDHVVKALAFLALCIHWFNPLVWLSFHLATKDMEMSCDEAVIRKMGESIRADYSASLLTLATGQRIIAGTPLAFGEGDTKGRIKNLANWKKPAFLVILIAVVGCIILAICLLTNPVDTQDWEMQAEDGYYLIIGANGVTNIEITTPNTSGGCCNADGSPFQESEKVYLEPLEGISDLRGVSITAQNEAGNILYAFSVPEGISDGEVIDIIASDGWLLTPTESSVDNVTMIPTTANMSGSFDSYLYVPLDGETYRFECIDMTPENVTVDKLLDQFTETADPENVDWKVYSLKEYPNHSVVLAVAGEDYKSLYQYSPSKRSDSNALQQAKESGYVVMEDGDVTSGQQVWQDFVNATQEGNYASVEIAHYYTLDPESCSEEYYEAYREDYPVIYIFNLTYDGIGYTLHWREGNTEQVRNYKYLMHYTGDAPTTYATYDTYARYVLTNDNTVTWEDIFQGMISSQIGQSIEHYSIYTDLS